MRLLAGSGNYVIGNSGTASANIDDNDVSPVTLNPPTVPGGTVAAAYVTQNFSATGGAGPYTFTLSGGALPGGITLTSAGVLSGTPTAAGVFDFAVSVTDSTSPGLGGPFSGSRVYQIVVAKGNQSITFGTLGDRALYSAPFVASAT